MNATLALHGTVFLTTAIYVFVCFLWGLVLAIRKQPISPSYRGALRLAVLVILAEDLLGLILFFLFGQHPETPLHWLYGIVIALALPAGESLGQQWWKGRRQTLVVAIACLFAFGLAIRASMTGGPA